ncbi:MAG: HD domain-containing protein [Candidatus Altiarchaeota archaeon]
MVSQEDVTTPIEMKKGKIIRDPIHGNIKADELEIKLIDTPEMQRLRRIKQNGFCYLIYPAMTSSRFEHSLGVMHLAGLISDHLGLNKEQRKFLRVSALLHDIGHFPFSHSSEEVLKKYGFSHEENSAEIITKSEISEILEDEGISPKEVADFIKGKGELSKLLSSEIDIDKMDYLIRDSYYAGVAYGVIDLQRVIHGIKIFDDKVVVKKSSLEAVESLLISRNLMYQTVYRHHTKRIVESMFKHALEFLFKTKKLNYKDFVNFDDFDIVSLLRKSKGYGKEMIERIDNRALFKIFFQQNVKELPENFIKKIKENSESIEKKISDDFGISQGYVLIDFPNTKLSEFEIVFETENSLRKIDEISSLANALKNSEQEKLTFCIYTPLEMKEKFKDFNIANYF